MYVRLTFTYLVYVFLIQHDAWILFPELFYDPKELRQISFCQVQMVHRHPTSDGEEDVG